MDFGANEVGTGGTDESVPYDSVLVPTKAVQASLFPTGGGAKKLPRTD